MSANRPADNLIGKMLGQFEVIEEIGRGGMATVYRARQKSINRIVALKVLPPSLLHDPTFYERFTREVDVIAHLEHPHIVPIYDYGEADGIPFIAMRFLAGGSIATFIRRGLPTVEQIERPLSQVAQALDYAHLRGIIHRDLKPGNMLLDEHLNAYLTDFGIARVLNSNLTGSAIIGTPAYMSPEQANGLPVDGRSDVYAVGIVLFELLTGREPFYADTPLALMLKHLNEPMPSVREYRPELPPALDWVVQKATAKNPDERYATAGDVARAFSEALRHTPFSDVDSPTTFMSAPARPTPLPHTPVPRSTPLPDERTITPGKLTPPSRQFSGAPGVTPPASARTTPLSTSSGIPTPPIPDQPTMRDVPAAAAMISGAAALPSTDAGAVMPPRRRSRLPIILGGLFVIALIAAGVIFLRPQVDPITVMPTPFPGSQLVQTSFARVNVPEGWTERVNNDSERQKIGWLLEDQAYFSVARVAADITSRDSFNYAVERYQRRYYNGWDWLRSLDTLRTASGWMRQSYAVDNPPPGAEFAPGQIDVFYVRRDPFLIVIETYTAFETGNTYVETLQAMVDSIRPAGA